MTNTSSMRHTSLDFPRPGVALLTLHHAEKSVNLLARQMLEEFEARLTEIATRTDVRGLVITSGKTGSFIAGADLAEFAASLDEPAETIIEVSRRGQQLFQRLANLPMVVIAAIDGVCVGGGAELAMWCDRRIMTRNEKTQLGFPEVKLGLFPGWGGTARTPRMIGLGNAVELITAGDSIGATEAYKLGIANDLVNTADQLLDAADRMVAAESDLGTYRLDREKWKQSIDISETELAFLGATAVAVINQKTEGHYPAPLAALEVMLEGSQVDIDAALQLEAERFAPLFGSPVNRALLNVFFLQDRNKKQAIDQEQAPLNSIGVIGAGTMGLGIAAVSLRRGLKVTLADNRAEALASGEKKVLEEAAFDREKKGPSLNKVLELVPQLHLATDAADVA